MFAINLDEEGYIKTISDKYRKPESVLVASIPDEADPEKLRCYKYDEDALVFDAEKWAAIEAKRAEEAAERNAKAAISNKRQAIAELKERIESTDYQIIKCYEYSLIGLEMPYNIEELHAERQALRDEINELEKELNEKE